MDWTQPLTLPPKTRIVHATLTYHDERNAADTVRGLGFRAVCECGDPFRVRASYRMARADLREHAQAAHRTRVGEDLIPTGEREG